MGAKVIAAADRIFVALHFVAWCLVVGTWALAWEDGPAPSGLQFNFADDFIGAVDYFVHCNVHSLAMEIAQALTIWFSADFGASYEIALAGLLLGAGTLQWFLLGRFTQWTARTRGQRTALFVFSVLCIWIAGAFLYWVVR